MGIYLTSDNHFGHVNVIKYSGRPFNSVEEMHEVMIENWNKIIKPGDVLYHLGDFSLSRKWVETLTPKLNGCKILVAGNHDRVHPIQSNTVYEKWRKIYWEYGWQDVQLELNWPGALVGSFHIRLSHFPYASDRSDERYQEWRPKKDKEAILFCGHVHEKWKYFYQTEYYSSGIGYSERNKTWTEERLAAINVGVDQWDYTPVNLEELIEVVKKNGK